MAWCRSGDKPLSEPMMVSLPMHICITRPQWVKHPNSCECFNSTTAGWFAPSQVPWICLRLSACKCATARSFAYQACLGMPLGHPNFCRRYNWATSHHLKFHGSILACRCSTPRLFDWQACPNMPGVHPILMDTVTLQLLGWFVPSQVTWMHLGL